MLQQLLENYNTSILTNGKLLLIDLDVQVILSAMKYCAFIVCVKFNFPPTNYCIRLNTVQRQGA